MDALQDKQTKQSVTQTCADCGAETSGKFCSSCGQETHLHRSLSHLGHELLHGVAHFDGRFWRTLPLLWINPGKLTREWVQGRRTRYVQPLALFLCTLFVLFMALTFTSSKPNDAEPVREESVRALQQELFIDIGGGENHPIMKTIQKKLNNPEFAVYKVEQTIYKFSFLILPFSIPCMWLLFFWRRDIYLYDHSVFVLYSLTFITMLTIILFWTQSIHILGQMLFYVALILIPIHMFAQLRGAYSLSIIGALWRTVLLLIFCSIVMVLFILTVIYLGLGH